MFKDDFVYPKQTCLFTLRIIVILDKTLKGIRGVRLDNQKVFSRTRYLDQILLVHILCRSINYIFRFCICIVRKSFYYVLYSDKNIYSPGYNVKLNPWLINQ